MMCGLSSCGCLPESQSAIHIRSYNKISYMTVMYHHIFILSIKLEVHQIVLTVKRM